jgi:hypothetical protein
MDIERVGGPTQFWKAFEKLNFVKLPDRDPSTLEALGYYEGFPCPHGHTTRQKDKHWCYDCALKIMSNICSFNINHLHNDYKHDAYFLFGDRLCPTDVEVVPGDWDECWSPTRKKDRIRAMSWRNYKTKTKQMVRIQKVVYGLCWGDVGSASVTMSCGNSRCLNPLHMRTSFNLTTPPDRMQEFVNTVDMKAMLVGQEMIAEYKAAITNPKDLQDLE